MRIIPASSSRSTAAPTVAFESFVALAICGREIGPPAKIASNTSCSLSSRRMFGPATALRAVPESAIGRILPDRRAFGWTRSFR